MADFSKTLQPKDLGTLKSPERQNISFGVRNEEINSRTKLAQIMTSSSGKFGHNQSNQGEIDNQYHTC